MKYNDFLTDFREYSRIVSRVRYIIESEDFMRVFYKIPYDEFHEVLYNAIIQHDETLLRKFLRPYLIDMRDLEELTYRELKLKARKLEIQHWSRLSKYELIIEIRRHEEITDDT